ncbi:hypothetical protein JYK00_02650 [Thermosipho ferrireducens]|uniref:Uncharacterized protein n=1 Tax=Thermosipho ferrireducens TaxID=2571116 RepID=A0ABX7S767_9BACT|nr:hypothetical protein [Thermosipho ferrireducens]QTA38442.1 hypothetical protein JYK00_02650 [Thermosipho ferrireducens]
MKKTLGIVYIIIFVSIIFPETYHAFRFILEYGKNFQTFRYEEIYYKDGDKIVIVKGPKKITWVKLGNNYYIGTTNKLLKCPPIKDLEDIFKKYASEHKLGLNMDGEITIVENAFSIKVQTLNGKIYKIIRKFKDVSTEMQYTYVPSVFTFDEILERYVLIEKSYIPERMYKIFNVFLWFSVSYINNKLIVKAVDKEGEEAILEISDKSGDYKIDEYYLTIKKASGKTWKEIENALGDNN